MWVQTQGGSRGSAGGRQLLLVRFRVGGGVADTVSPPAMPNVERAENIIVTGTTNAGGRSSRGISVPFQPYAHRVWNPPGRFVTARGDRYAVNVHLSTNRVLSLRRDAPAVEVSDAEYADRRRYVEAQVEYFEKTSSGQRAGPIPEIPRTKPPVSGLFSGLDGRIWVKVAVPSERFAPPEPLAVGNAPAPPVLAWRERLAYDVYDTDFTLLGRVILPADVRRAAGWRGEIWSWGDHVWCIATDIDGVEEIRRYRIVWR
jgi:hypothetical protein